MLEPSSGSSFGEELEGTSINAGESKQNGEISEFCYIFNISDQSENASKSTHHYYGEPRCTSVFANDAEGHR